MVNLLKHFILQLNFYCILLRTFAILLIIYPCTAVDASDAESAAVVEPPPAAAVRSRQVSTGAPPQSLQVLGLVVLRSLTPDDCRYTRNIGWDWADAT